MVTILFDKCAELWSGCPAVEAMDNGIDTAEEIPGDYNPDESESGLLPFAANDPAREDNTGVTTSDESAKKKNKKKLLMQEETGHSKVFTLLIQHDSIFDKIVPPK